MGNNSSKKTCVVCGHYDDKEYFCKRSSGYKCPGCVGTSSNKQDEFPERTCNWCGSIIPKGQVRCSQIH